MVKTTGKKIFRRVYEVISTVIILAGAGLAVMYLLGVRLYHVKSGSMGDALPVGCVCFVDTHYGFGRVKAGDIIAFRVDEDMLVTHRAVRLSGEGIYTRGDKNEADDPDPVTEDNYIGRTFYEIPRVGAALEFFHTKKGAAVLAGAVLLIVAAGFVYRYAGKDNNTDNDKTK